MDCIPSKTSLFKGGGSNYNLYFFECGVLSSALAFKKWAIEFIITLQQIAKSLSGVQFLKGCEREFGSRLMDDILLFVAVIKGCQRYIRFVVDGRCFIVTHSPKFSPWGPLISGSSVINLIPLYEFILLNWLSLTLTIFDFMTIYLHDV